MTGLKTSALPNTAGDPILLQATEEWQQFVARECRRMIGQSEWLRRWEETDDLAGRVWISVLEAIFTRKVAPDSREHLKHIISLHVRWVTANVRRAIRRRPNHVSGEVYERMDETTPPGTGFDWADFHLAVTELPDSERSVFERIWYDEVTRKEVAEESGLSMVQVQRRYRAARERLMRRFPEF